MVSTSASNIFARKGSGGYYTPDDLVGLIIDEAVGPLVDARMKAPLTPKFPIPTVDQQPDVEKMEELNTSRPGRENTGT